MQKSAATSDAIEALLDRQAFLLDDEHHEAFLRMLETPARANEKLKRLMSSKSPWER